MAGSEWPTPAWRPADRCRQAGQPRGPAHLPYVPPAERHHDNGFAVTWSPPLSDFSSFDSWLVCLLCQCATHSTLGYELTTKWRESTASLQQRNSGRAVWQSGVFSDGDDTANNHSRGGHRQDAKEPNLAAPPPLNTIQRKAAHPVLFPQWSVSTRSNSQLTWHRCRADGVPGGLAARRPCH